MSVKFREYSAAYKDLTDLCKQFTQSVNQLINDKKLSIQWLGALKHRSETQLAFTFCDINILLDFKVADFENDQFGEKLHRQLVIIQRFSIDNNGMVSFVGEPIQDEVQQNGQSSFGNNCYLIDSSGLYCLNYLEAIINRVLASSMAVKQKQQG